MSDEKMFLEVTMTYTLSDGTMTNQSYIVVGTKNRIDLAVKEADEHLRGNLRASDENISIVKGRAKLVKRLG